jgi:hypothetical protein
VLVAVHENKTIESSWVRVKLHYIHAEKLQYYSDSF